MCLAGTAVGGSAAVHVFAQIVSADSSALTCPDATCCMERAGVQPTLLGHDDSQAAVAPHVAAAAAACTPQAVHFADAVLSHLLPPDVLLAANRADLCGAGMPTKNGTPVIATEQASGGPLPLQMLPRSGREPV